MAKGERRSWSAVVARSLVEPCCRHARSLARIRGRVVVVRSDVTIRMSRDPKDDKCLEYAVAGGADYLVSGAEDLVLGEVPGIPIVDVPAFWQKLLTGV